MVHRQILYVIDYYKFASGLLYGLLLAALSLPLVFSRIALIASHPSTTLVSYPQDVLPKLGPNGITPVSYLSDSTVTWPIHGMVTTEFGVYHEPYQRTHTGIDISSAKPSGTTSVTTFKEGTVLQTTYSSKGYGNHVVIDHGNGLTSLYGHLSSIRVAKGARVLPGDILGYEGSTGDSTGTHVHFEIRLNDIPVNPRNYLVGNP